MLRQLMMARHALLLLDGIDEGGRKRSDLERHITETLANQGHCMLVTSRPAGLNDAIFGNWSRVQLRPLDSRQQTLVIRRRLGAQHSDRLIAYLKESVPHDTVTGDLITANPLMLSMLVSICKNRIAEGGGDGAVSPIGVAAGQVAASGVGASSTSFLPKTVAELYEKASSAMLE